MADNDPRLKFSDIQAYLSPQAAAFYGEGPIFGPDGPKPYGPLEEELKAAMLTGEPFDMSAKLGEINPTSPFSQGLYMATIEKMLRDMEDIPGQPSQAGKRSQLLNLAARSMSSNRDPLQMHSANQMAQALLRLTNPDSRAPLPTPTATATPTATQDPDLLDLLEKRKREQELLDLAAQGATPTPTQGPY